MCHFFQVKMVKKPNTLFPWILFERDSKAVGHIKYSFVILSLKIRFFTIKLTQKNSYHSFIAISDSGNCSVEMINNREKY